MNVSSVRKRRKSNEKEEAREILATVRMQMKRLFVIFAFLFVSYSDSSRIICHCPALRALCLIACND